MVSSPLRSGGPASILLARHCTARVRWILSASARPPPSPSRTRRLSLRRGRQPRSTNSSGATSATGTSKSSSFASTSTKAPTRRPRPAAALTTFVSRLRVGSAPALALHALPHRRDLARPLRRRSARQIHRPHPLPASLRLPSDSRVGQCHADDYKTIITTVRALRKELGVPEKEMLPTVFTWRRERLNLCAPRNPTSKHDRQALARLSKSVVTYRPSKHLTGSNARRKSSFTSKSSTSAPSTSPPSASASPETSRNTKKASPPPSASSRNDAFLAKAPAHIVEGLRKQAAETRTLYEKTKAALDALPHSNNA